MSNPIVPVQGSQWRGVLQSGMTGYEVAALQLNLNQAACGSAGLVIDGDYGPLTAAAVTAFQKTHTTTHPILGPWKERPTQIAAGHELVMVPQSDPYYAAGFRYEEIILTALRGPWKAYPRTVPVGATVVAIADNTPKYNEGWRYYAYIEPFDPLHPVLTTNGVADQLTQQVMAQQFIKTFQTQFSLPPGLLEGITQNESDWFVGAVVWHSDVSAVDVGWVQDSTSYASATDVWYTNAFNGSSCFLSTSQNLRNAKDTFMPMPGVKGNEELAWKYAILDHNWPSAAYTLAWGQTLSDQPATWVTNLGVAGVTTPAQWANFYIGRCDMFITNWDY